MGVKMFGYRNKLLKKVQLQDCQLMNRRLTFEVKESKSKYNVTFWLYESGRLERMVTVEVAAPTEEDLQELRGRIGSAPNLQDTSGQNLFASYTTKLNQIN